MAETKDPFSIKKITDDSWLVIQGGVTVSLVHKKDNKFVLLTSDTSMEYDTMEELKSQFGGKLRDIVASETDDSDGDVISDIDGYPVKHKNTTTIRGGDSPLYMRGKTPHVAGYWCIKFSKRWVPSFCPLQKTAEQYESMGPFKTRFEMMANLATLNR